MADASSEAVNLRIKFKSDTLEGFTEKYGADVSRGGIFIRTKEPLAVGTAVKFDLSLQTGSPILQGTGTVVWNRSAESAKPGTAPGMGVRFDRLEKDSQASLAKIIAAKDAATAGTGAQAPAGGGRLTQTFQAAFGAAPTAAAVAAAASAPAAATRPQVPAVGGPTAPAMAAAPSAPAAMPVARATGTTGTTGTRPTVDSFVDDEVKTQIAPSSVRRETSAPMPMPSPAGSGAHRIPTPTPIMGIDAATGLPRGLTPAGGTPAWSSRMTPSSGVPAPMVGGATTAQVHLTPGGGVPLPGAGKPLFTPPPMPIEPALELPGGASDLARLQQAQAAKRRSRNVVVALIVVVLALGGGGYFAWSQGLLDSLFAPASRGVAVRPGQVEYSTAKAPGPVVAQAPAGAEAAGGEGEAAAAPAGLGGEAAGTAAPAPGAVAPAAGEAAAPAGAPAAAVAAPAPTPGKAGKPIARSLGGEPTAADDDDDAPVAGAGEEVYWLRVTSTPMGAEVLLDGELQGKTPFQRRIFDPGRSYNVIVQRAGYEPHEEAFSSTSAWKKKGNVMTLTIATKLSRARPAARPQPSAAAPATEPPPAEPPAAVAPPPPAPAPAPPAPAPAPPTSGVKPNPFGDSP